MNESEAECKFAFRFAAFIWTRLEESKQNVSGNHHEILRAD